jgi:hypothetical protein
VTGWVGSAHRWFCLELVGKVIVERNEVINVDFDVVLLEMVVSPQLRPARAQTSEWCDDRDEADAAVSNPS